MAVAEAYERVAKFVDDLALSLRARICDLVRMAP